MTVQEVKEGLADQLATAAEHQRFFWRMRSLPDHSSWEALGMTSGEPRPRISLSFHYYYYCYLLI